MQFHGLANTNLPIPFGPVSNTRVWKFASPFNELIKRLVQATDRSLRADTSDLQQYLYMMSAILPESGRPSRSHRHTECGLDYLAAVASTIVESRSLNARSLFLKAIDMRSHRARQLGSNLLQLANLEARLGQVENYPAQKILGARSAQKKFHDRRPGRQRWRL